MAALVMLTACGDTPRSSPLPPARPAGLTPDTTSVAPRSAESQDLAQYYKRVQNDLLTRGLLRTDGGGPDTPYDASDLERNFVSIAFFNEYDRGATLPTGSRSSGRLSRWSTPVRVRTEFGPSVPEAQRDADLSNVKNFTGRLARLTGHPVTNTSGNSNFLVFFAGLDDTLYVQDRLRQLMPGVTQEQIDLFDKLPRDFYCFVFATTERGAPYTYTRAVALVRAEHPDLVRLSCIHEEIAQGLGLSNDSPAARPSIFNDDDEFALLTSHDEKLLTMLYDPRLKQGMSAEEARPVIRILAREQMGEEL